MEWGSVEQRKVIHPFKNIEKTQKEGKLSRLPNKGNY